MGIDDLKGKASDAVQGEKGEQASDSAMEKGADAASSATGGKHDEHIDKAQSAADEKIGDQ
ncbi:antitoxin [Cellulomonas sp. zg-ZUI222]|uniref:Antitoxin n=1 Tax=Cellulomonas wangleii TaxID=2816956 RepID=A0ABX8D3S7_9CELL|nr:MULTISPECIES: antitoxin [Cellulomonas]MBO0898898.1 antitoxin [Cellulomonas sp. zg-ZUI22]MBO0919759.1 antitoxin [Cellulomonas wangleii]MBO0923815.1 antitoxin [Cellulomonas wangleii]MBO0924097.1 antitoxin [Cellulomonas wangleii]QVI62122.1 antitoxin [Cellulomonas wangleii]